MPEYFLLLSFSGKYIQSESKRPFVSDWPKGTILSVCNKKIEKKFCRAENLSTFAASISPDGGIGRRAGLKHQWIHFHAGSIPALGTSKSAK